MISLRRLFARRPTHTDQMVAEAIEQARLHHQEQRYRRMFRDRPRGEGGFLVDSSFAGDLLRVREMQDALRRSPILPEQRAIMTGVK